MSNYYNIDEDALRTPADGDMVAMKAKADIVIAMTPPTRKTAYSMIPKIELMHVRAYVDMHSKRNRAKSRRKNNKSNAWSFAVGSRAAIPKS